MKKRNQKYSKAFQYLLIDCLYRVLIDAKVVPSIGTRISEIAMNLLPITKIINQ